jgi:hypothetical protein
MDDLNDRYDPTAFFGHFPPGCRTRWTTEECMTRLGLLPAKRLPLGIVPICTTDFLVRRLVLTDMDVHRTDVISYGCYFGTVTKHAANGNPDRHLFAISTLRIDS